MTITIFVLSSAHWVIRSVITIIEIDAYLSLLGPVPRKLPPWTVIADVFEVVNVSVHCESRNHIIICEHP